MSLALEYIEDRPQILTTFASLIEGITVETKIAIQVLEVKNIAPSHIQGEETAKILRSMMKMS